MTFFFAVCLSRSFFMSLFFDFTLNLRSFGKEVGKKTLYGFYAREIGIARKIFYAAFLDNNTQKSINLSPCFDTKRVANCHISV